MKVLDRLSHWRGLLGPLQIAGSTGASALAALGVALFAAERFSRGEYGQFVLFLGTSVLISSMCDLGVSNRMVTAYEGADHDRSQGRLFDYWSGQAWSYGLGIALTTLVVVFSEIATFLNVEGSILIWGAAYGGAIGLSSFFQGILQAKQRWKERSQYVLLQAAARTVGATPGIILGDVHLAAAGSVVGALAALAIATRWEGLSGLRSLLDRAPSPARALTAWKESRWFAVAIVAGAATSYFPVAAVAHVGQEQLAILGLALQLATGPQLLLNAVMTFLLPRSVDPNIPTGSYIRLSLAIGVRLVGVVGLVACTAPFVLPLLFQGRFRGSIVPLEILLFSVACLALANPIQFLHYRVHRERFLATLDILMLVVTVITYVVALRFVDAPTSGALALLLGFVLPKVIGVSKVLRDPAIPSGRATSNRMSQP